MKRQAVAALLSGLAIGTVLGGVARSGETGAPSVEYPEGYRDWTHVKSMVIEPGHPLYEALGGIHHIYANDEALEASKSGTAYPDGAVLILDRLEAKSENNAVVEGARKLLAVMEKDSRRFADTGGWGFEGFKGDTRERVADPKTACFGCHEARKPNDYVFSRFRE